MAGLAAIHQAGESVVQLLRARRDLMAEQGVLGPVPAPMEKRAGRYRAQLLLQSNQRPALHGLLDALMEHARALPSGRRCRWHLDVDPIDLL